ncbi:acyl-CoA N-acyltransferase [Lipomyces chichibuensis]|uniref:acyl-CoA N-acyltransferase n=1 Tax=Lipomyces chichibuensis TaxID=1546026 RepID=UPI003343785B
MTHGSSASAQIRPAEDGDLEAITAIYGYHVRCGTASFETEPPTVEEMRRRRATLLDRGYPYLVAERDGVVIGYAYASNYHSRAAYRDTVENSIYLDPDAIGQGVGSGLMANLIAACEACGFRQMVAIIGDSANIHSVKLHERHGFSLIGTLRSVGYKHGRWLDTIIFQRKLGFGDSEPPRLRMSD